MYWNIHTDGRTDRQADTSCGWASISMPAEIRRRAPPRFSSFMLTSKPPTHSVSSLMVSALSDVVPDADIMSPPRADRETPPRNASRPAALPRRGVALLPSRHTPAGSARPLPSIEGARGTLSGRAARTCSAQRQRQQQRASQKFLKHTRHAARHAEHARHAERLRSPHLQRAQRQQQAHVTTPHPSAHVWTKDRGHGRGPRAGHGSATPRVNF